jgi:hypothetical protein
MSLRGFCSPNRSSAIARLIELDSVNHLVLANEPAWQVVRAKIRAFIAAD